MSTEENLHVRGGEASALSQAPLFLSFPADVPFLSTGPRGGATVRGAVSVAASQPRPSRGSGLWGAKLGISVEAQGPTC